MKYLLPEPSNHNNYPPFCWSRKDIGLKKIHKSNKRIEKIIKDDEDNIHFFTIDGVGFIKNEDIE